MEYFVAVAAQSLPLSVVGIVTVFFFRKALAKAIVAGVLGAMSLPLMGLLTNVGSIDVLLFAGVWGALYGFGWGTVERKKRENSQRKSKANHRDENRNGENLKTATSKDYYQILGISPTVEPEALKAVYRALAKKYHPDTTNSTTTSETFRDIQEAYDVLSDPELRERYDRERGEDGEVGEKEDTYKHPKGAAQKEAPLSEEDIDNMFSEDVEMDTSQESGGSFHDVKEKFTTSIFPLLAKFLLGIVLCAVVASLITGLAGVFLQDSSFRVNTQSNILFGLMVGSFVFFVFIVGLSIFKRDVGKGKAQVKKIIFIFIGGLILLAALISYMDNKSNKKISGKPNYQIWNTQTNNVNGRMGPGTNYEIAFKVPTTVNLGLIEKRGGWGQFTYNTADGNVGRIWISMDFVSKQEQPSYKSANSIFNKGEPLGSGLDIQDVQSRRGVEGGADTLVVTGTVANVTGSPRDVPFVRISLFNSDGEEVQFLNLPPNTAQISANGKMNFKGSIVNPATTARRLEVTFVASSKLAPGAPVYHEFPQLVVDLKKSGDRTNYIKIKIVVEIVERDLPILQSKELMIVDKFQRYLRSQTRADVAGGTGTEHMRRGITKIVSDVMGEVRIEGVLFREILLQ